MQHLDTPCSALMKQKLSGRQSPRRMAATNGGGGRAPHNQGFPLPTALMYATALEFTFRKRFSALHGRDPMPIYQRK
ncbi:hypothetical protein A7D27_08240 [Pseudomonas sp. 1D4]|nr:hypothetical protein A7D27_08240 [Pseudomonas sp. 1D4]